MSKKSEHTAEHVLLLITARALHEHLTNHGNLKAMDNGATQITEALKPFDEAEEKAD